MPIYRTYVTAWPPYSDSLHGKSYLKMGLNRSDLPKSYQQFPLSTLTCQVHPFIYPSQSGRGNHLRWIESSFFGQLKPGFQASPDSPDSPPPPQKKHGGFRVMIQVMIFSKQKLLSGSLYITKKNSTAVDWSQYPSEVNLSNKNLPMSWVCFWQLLGVIFLWESIEAKKPFIGMSWWCFLQGLVVNAYMTYDIQSLEVGGFSPANSLYL